MNKKAEIERITKRWRNEKRIAAADVDMLLAWAMPVESEPVGGLADIFDAFFGNRR